MESFDSFYESVSSASLVLAMLTPVAILAFFIATKLARSGSD